MVQSMADYSFYNYRVMYLFWVFIGLSALFIKRSSLSEGSGLTDRDGLPEGNGFGKKGNMPEKDCLAEKSELPEGDAQPEKDGSMDAVGREDL